MIDRITVMRYQIFSRNLFERRTSPLLPSVWLEVADRFPTIVGRIRYYGANWLEQVERHRAALLGVLAAALIAALLIRGVVTSLIDKRRGRFEGIPNFFDRIISAAVVAPARMLAPMAAVSILYVGMDSLGMFFSPWERTAETALLGVLIYVAGSVLASVSLAPRQPQWRLIPVDDGTAAYILCFVKAILALYIIDTVLVEFGRAIYVPLIMTVAQGFITNIATAVLLLVLLLRPFVPQTGPLRAVNHLDRLDPDGVSRFAPLSIKLPFLVLAVAIIASSAIGYVALGRYIAQQIVLTGTILAAAGLIYLGIRAVTRRRDDAISPLGSLLEGRFGIERTRQGQIVKLAEIAAMLGLVLVALPLLMLQWGFAGADIRDWAKALFFGFEVGQFRISLMRILFGIVLFIALLFLTRLIQHWLRERVLAQSRMDAGVANSVELAVGYTGIGLAALMSRLLRRLRCDEPRHRRRRPVGRHRLRPAVDREQLRVGPDPAGRASDQGRRLDRGRRSAGQRASHFRALDRDRDVRPGEPHRAELRADLGPCSQLDAPQHAGPHRPQDHDRHQDQPQGGDRHPREGCRRAEACPDDAGAQGGVGNLHARQHRILVERRADRRQRRAIA